MTLIDEMATIWQARKYTVDDRLFQFVPLVIKGAFKHNKTCEVVTFPLVSWVRCGACLYRFMIFALFLTFLILLFCNGRFNLPHMPKPLGPHPDFWASIRIAIYN